MPPPPFDVRRNPTQSPNEARFDLPSTAANAPANAIPSLEPRRAPTHHLALAHQLGVELAAVEGEVDVEVDAVESALRGIHALEVLFQVLAAEIGRQGDDFLDTYNA